MRKSRFSEEQITAILASESSRSPQRSLNHKIGSPSPIRRPFGPNLLGGLVGEKHGL